MIGYTVHHMMDPMDRVQKERVFKVAAMPVTKEKHSELFGCSMAPNTGERGNMQNFQKNKQNSQKYRSDISLYVSTVSMINSLSETM